MLLLHDMHCVFETLIDNQNEDKRLEIFVKVFLMTTIVRKPIHVVRTWPIKTIGANLFHSVNVTAATTSTPTDTCSDLLTDCRLWESR